jgi:hypothetical protein
MYLLKNRIPLLLVFFYFAICAANAQTLKITGLPINIGDTLEQVQQTMQTSATPAPYESKINPNGTRLPFSAKGIIVFFDAAGKVAIIRLEKNFAGNLNGLKYGDVIESVTQQFGAPLLRSQTKEGIETLTYDFENRVNFEYNNNKRLNVIFLREADATKAKNPHSQTPVASYTKPTAAADITNVSTRTSSIDSSQSTKTVQSPPDDKPSGSETQAMSPRGDVIPASPRTAEYSSTPKLTPNQLSRERIITTNAKITSLLVVEVQNNEVTAQENDANSEVLKNHKNRVVSLLALEIGKMPITTNSITVLKGPNQLASLWKAIALYKPSHILEVRIPTGVITTQTRGFFNKSQYVSAFTLNAKLLEVPSLAEVYKYDSEKDRNWSSRLLAPKSAADIVFNDMKSKGIF